MKFEFQIVANENNTNVWNAIKLIPETNLEMRHLDWLHENADASFFKKCMTSNEIHYMVIFTPVKKLASKLAE